MGGAEAAGQLAGVPGAHEEVRRAPDLERGVGAEGDARLHSEAGGVGQLQGVGHVEAAGAAGPRGEVAGEVVGQGVDRSRAHHHHHVPGPGLGVERGPRGGGVRDVAGAGVPGGGHGRDQLGGAPVGPRRLAPLGGVDVRQQRLVGGLEGPPELLEEPLRALVEVGLEDAPQAPPGGTRRRAASRLTRTSVGWWA